MWWRRSWFSLKGKADIPGQTEGCPATSIGPRVLPVGSLQQRGACARGYPRDVEGRTASGLQLARVRERLRPELGALQCVLHRFQEVRQPGGRGHRRIVQKAREL